jgi:N-acetylneuraminic acid mutarotase
MLKISWKRGPSLPQGFQDSFGGVIDDTLVTACGFCTGFDLVEKPGKYPRGFLRKAWGLNLRSPTGRWRELPDFPGHPRQGPFGAVVGRRLYCWGGFSYSAPYCYQDGYCLSEIDGEWRWEPLPSLPYPLCFSGSCAIGRKIYILGGQDFDNVTMPTECDRNGDHPRMGSQLYVMDTGDLASGWKRLAECPGTHRASAAVAAVGGTIYVIGGIAVPREKPVPDEGPTKNMDVSDSSGVAFTVVDSWAYEPAEDRWRRLRDLPVATGGFPAGGGKILFGERYIVLVGGYQYAAVMNPDGSFRESYGQAHKHYSAEDRFSDTPSQHFGDYYSDVFVYDTCTQQFGRADPLPMNNFMPLAVLRGNQLYLTGGETGGSQIEGEIFAHHPDLLLIGTIEEMGGL